MAKRDPHNAADEKQVEAQAKRDENRRKQELIDIKDMLETPAGKRFFRRLMKDGLVFQTTFTGNSQGYFLEGHRNLALKYLHDVVEAAPNMVAELMRSEEE